jgi:hypothetical protein
MPVSFPRINRSEAPVTGGNGLFPGMAGPGALQVSALLGTGTNTISNGSAMPMRGKSLTFRIDRPKGLGGLSLKSIVSWEEHY